MRFFTFLTNHTHQPLNVNSGLSQLTSVIGPLKYYAKTKPPFYLTKKNNNNVISNFALHCLKHPSPTHFPFMLLKINLKNQSISCFATSNETPTSETYCLADPIRGVM